MLTRHSVTTASALILASNAASLGASLPAYAAPAPSAKPVWDLKVKPDAGAVEFRATGRPSALKIVGKAPGPDGQLTVQNDVLNGSLEFRLDALATGITMRDEHMRTKYLETGKYPTAKLTIADLKLPKDLSAAGASVDGIPFQGKLTLHGVEKPVTGTFSARRAGADVDSTAQFSLHIADYGIANPGFAGVTVADEVQLNVSLKGTPTKR